MPVGEPRLWLDCGCLVCLRDESRGAGSVEPPQGKKLRKYEFFVSDIHLRDISFGNIETCIGQGQQFAVFFQEGEHCAIVVGERAVCLVKCRFSVYSNRKRCEFFTCRPYRNQRASQ